MHHFTFDTCRSLISEVGAVRNLGILCRKLNVHLPLIVSDPGIEKLGLIQTVQRILSQEGISSYAYTDVIADPPEQVINEALAFAKQKKVDAVIGFGGGSSMDTAKLVALLAHSSETLADIYGVDKVKGQRLPLIQIPTTAGTGSEVTPIAIVTTGETTKQGVVSSRLLPDIALLDAELTIGLPEPITAMTGIDAMVHAVEAFTSIRKKNPYSDMLAKQALTLLSENILRVTDSGHDLAARQAMLLGACLAGQAFANAPVAAVHALAYPLGGHYHIPHGLSNSLVLPHVLRFNACEAEDWYAELAEIVIPVEQLSETPQQRCEQFIQYFVDLIRALRLPSTLALADVPEQELHLLAADAILQQRLLVNNPRTMTEADALAIYRAAY
ncbi:Long-chain-alcohol dehydrogenase 1 [Thalassocella blandensis]|nr:Long-chain-alcohol dehydrogenase 1 [Thalassocella blandensis]